MQIMIPLYLKKYVMFNGKFNKYFSGLMPTSWYPAIELWFSKYCFDDEVMVALFNYCFEKSALHRNYVQAVADGWSKNGIKTYFLINLVSNT